MSELQTNIALGGLGIFIAAVFLLPLYNGSGYNLLELDNLVDEYSKTKIIEEKKGEAENLKKSGQSNAEAFKLITQEDLDKIATAIPKVKSVPRSLNNLEKLATDNNVEVGDYKFSLNGSVKNDKINYYDVSFTVTGDYKDFINYITALDRGLEIYNVKGLTIKNNNKDIGADTYSFDLSLETFQLK